MANHGPSYGLDADIKKKNDDKVDNDLLQKATKYVEFWSGKTITDFHEDLKSGVVICEALNNIGKTYPHAYGGPPIRDINTGKLAFKQMENIGNFLTGCEKLGLKRTDLFMTVDLYEAKNIHLVVDTFIQLQRKFPEKS